MTLTHNSDGILVPSGTETLESIFNYNNSNALGLITFRDNRNYKLSGRIFATGGNINFSDQSIYVASGAFIGITAAGVITFQNCQVHGVGISASSESNRSDVISWAFATTASSGSSTPSNTSRIINFYNSSLNFEKDALTSGASRVWLSDVIDSIINGYSPNSTINQVVYIQGGRTVRNVVFRNLWLVDVTNGGTFSGVTFQNCRSGFNAQQAPSTITVSGYTNTGYTTNYIRMVSARFALINPTTTTLDTDLATALVWDAFGGNPVTPRLSVFYTVNLRFTGNLQGVKVAYRDKDGTTYLTTTNASGLMSSVLNLKLRESVGSSSNPGVTFTNYNNFTYTYRLYGYKAVQATGVAITAPTGDSSNPLISQLVADPVIIGSLATAATYTSLSVNHSTDTAAVSGSITIRQFYDRAQWDLYQDANLFEPDWFTSADGINFNCAYSLTIGSASQLTSAPLATITMGAGRTLTLSSTGTYNGFLASIPATGTVVVTGGGTTNLQGWTFASGSTINRTSGSATVIVDEDQRPNITAGTGVTLQAPTVFLAAPNFSEGARAQVSRVNQYSIAATDFDTTNNRINITGHAFRSTSFPSLVTIIPGSGATLPTATPTLEYPSLYYVVATSANWIQVSETEGGSVIDFSSQGSGSFTVLGWTELANGVAGVSGYSVALTEANNTLLQVKARFWQNSSGCTASSFYQGSFVWNSATGVSIADTLNASTTPDKIHNAIISATSLTLPDGTTATPTNDGSTVTGLAFQADGTVEIDINDPDGTLLVQDAYAWFVHQSSTQAGIRLVNAYNFFAEDLFNYVINSIKLENVNTSTPLRTIGGYIRTADGSNAISSESEPLFLNSQEKGVAVQVSGIGSSITVADVWNAATSGLSTGGSIGKLLTDNINASISSRQATVTFPTNFASLAITGGGAVTVGTNNDKTGYLLSGTQTFNLTGNITGNLSGSVGSVAGVTFPSDFSALTTVRKIVENNHLINETNNTLTIFDDNGTTPFRVYDLKDQSGNPANQQVYERRKQ